MRKTAALSAPLFLTGLLLAAALATGARSPSRGPVRLKVQPCSLTTGATGMTIRATPASLRVSLPAQVAGKVAAYGRAGLVALGPRGWRCDVLLAADGSSSIEVHPSKSAPKRRGGVRLEQAPACIGCIGDIACPFFDAAKKMAVAGCSYQPAVGESVTRLSKRLVAYYDPPKVRGYGFYSGFGYASYGRVRFDEQPPFAARADCALPARYKGLCPIAVRLLLPR
jgi:hypothetical protein